MFIKETKQEVSSGTYAFERRRAPPRSDDALPTSSSYLDLPCLLSMSARGLHCGSCACECEKSETAVCATAGGKYAINW